LFGEKDFWHGKEMKTTEDAEEVLIFRIAMERGKPAKPRLMNVAFDLL